MFKKYQIKWLLILSLSIILCTLFLVPFDLQQAKWWHYLDHSLKIFIPTATCWMIDGYFITNKFPRLSSRLKPFLSIFLGIIVLFLLGIVLYVISPKNHLFQEDIGYGTAREILMHLIGNSLLSILCYFVFSNRYTKAVLRITRMEKDRLEQEHLRAQLLSLQQQISPHFLFNSLSTLKTLVHEPLARDFIGHLASVYRYVLNFNEQYLTKLEDELNFIHSYVYILHERFGDMLKVNIQIPPQDLQLFLPSLSLQLLIENAIKHNICSEEKPLLISISTTQHQELCVENNFQPKSTRTERSGKGLKNIIDRYKILSDKPVEIHHSQDKFSVTIPLLKNESNHYRR